MKKFLLLVILTGICSNTVGADGESTPAPIRSRMLGVGPGPAPVRQGTGGPFAKKAARGRGMKRGGRKRPPMFDFSATKAAEEEERMEKRATSARSTELVLVELEALIRFLDEKKLLSDDHKARTARQVITETNGDYIEAEKNHISDKYSYAKILLNELYDIHGTYVGNERRKIVKPRQHWDPELESVVEMYPYERSFLEALAMHGEKKYPMKHRGIPAKAWQDFYDSQEKLPEVTGLVVTEDPAADGAWGRDMTLEEEVALLKAMESDIKHNKKNWPY